MNFDYFKDNEDFKALYQNCKNAEDLCFSQPTLSVTCAGVANEMVVRFLYDSLVGPSDDMAIYDMLMDWNFRKDIGYDQNLLDDFHFVRKMRNEVMHKGKICSVQDSALVLSHLSHAVQYLFNQLGLLSGYPSFVDPRDQKEEKTSVSVVSAESDENVRMDSEVVAKYSDKLRYTIFSTESKRDEEENKRRFFIASLTDSGWPIVNRNNVFLPCSATLNLQLENKEKCDAALYGRDSKPLAIIEYVHPGESVIERREDAIRKAKRISLKTGYMPVVYYTSGYMTYCIDGLGFPPRRVFSYHTVDELEVLIQRQSTRKDIKDPKIDTSIAGRSYQMGAIRAVCNAFSSNRRRSLVVLATGTGKTRLSIALSDILLKANWVKNILFLADRTSLVSQAHKNFTKLLPNVTSSVFTGNSLEKDTKARIIFSTYQTMINLVQGEHKAFGIGRFDLIIIDEAHRSLFRKYRSIFDYFDSMMLGLTATPRCEEEKSTFEVFQLPSNTPDYDYELEEAVKDGYLNSFALLDRTTELIKRNKKYSDLTEEEKDKLDEDFGEDNEVLKNFKEKDELVLSDKAINIPTIDAMLGDLMKNGIHVDNGDKIGKTIIFAKSHLEAKTICAEFSRLYPNLGNGFCKLIDCQTEGSQKTLDSFELRDKLPQIAVSVDMLDTGIDVPDILNLVFFKQLRSKIKFLQMIGRGTRLSEDVFGPGSDKTGFLIFDYFDNFSYFETAGSQEVRGNGCSISNRIQDYRLQILFHLENCHSIPSFDNGFMEELKESFSTTTKNLVNDDIEVENNMAYVSKYRTDGKFDSLSGSEVIEISSKILPLFPPIPGEPKTKSFDLFMYSMEEDFLSRKRRGADTKEIDKKDKEHISKLVNELLKLKNVPQVMAKAALLKDFYDDEDLFENGSLQKLEGYRRELRDLMSFLPDRKDFLITSFEDKVLDQDGEHTSFAKREPSYMEKVSRYLEDATKPSLAKIRNLDELTKAEQEELRKLFTVTYGTDADFKNLSGGMELLPYIRKQIGIAEEAIEAKLGSILHSPKLNEIQLSILEQILDYCKINGDIDFKKLGNVSPFSSIDFTNVFKANILDLKKFVTMLHKPVEWKN